MLLTISKEDSKRVKDFIKKSQKDGLSEIVIRVNSNNKTISYESSRFCLDETRNIKIEYNNNYSENFSEIVLDLRCEDLACEYFSNENIYIEVYKNNSNYFRIENNRGEISDTRYFIDTVVMYQIDKKGGKSKVIRVEKIGFSEDSRMIR